MHTTTNDPIRITPADAMAAAAPAAPAPRRTPATLALAVVAVLPMVSGCAWWTAQNRLTKGAVYGTGAGAAAGAAVGGIVGKGKGAATGAAIGAVVGAIGGGAIGYGMDRQADELKGITDRQDGLQRDGDTLKLSLGSEVMFPTGSATLLPGAFPKLQQIADVLVRYPRSRVDITGHTDARGAQDANLRLSERRAAAVRDALVKDGVEAARIVTHGAGAALPVADNRTDSGRAMNRRVELVIRPGDTGPGAPAAGVDRHPAG